MIRITAPGWRERLVQRQDREQPRLAGLPSRAQHPVPGLRADDLHLMRPQRGAAEHLGELQRVAERGEELTGGRHHQPRETIGQWTWTH